MGKTQLAAEFARRHHRCFSSVLWLDGRSEDVLKRSIASCALLDEGVSHFRSIKLARIHTRLPKITRCMSIESRKNATQYLFLTFCIPSCLRITFAILQASRPPLCYRLTQSRRPLQAHYLHPAIPLRKTLNCNPYEQQLCMILVVCQVTNSQRMRTLLNSSHSLQQQSPWRNDGITQDPTSAALARQCSLL